MRPRVVAGGALLVGGMTGVAVVGSCFFSAARLLQGVITLSSERTRRGDPDWPVMLLFGGLIIGVSLSAIIAARIWAALLNSNTAQRLAVVGNINRALAAGRFLAPVTGAAVGGTAIVSLGLWFVGGLSLMQDAWARSSTPHALVMGFGALAGAIGGMTVAAIVVTRAMRLSDTDLHRVWGSGE